MKQQQGVSLIEVMVAVVILSFSLLGLGALQAKALPLAQSSIYRSTAADLAADLASRIRANRTPYLVKDDSGKTPSDFPKQPDFSQCKPSQSNPKTLDCGMEGYRTQDEMTEWLNTLTNQLPEGGYELNKVDSSASGFYRYTLTINWKDNRMSNETFSYKTVIE